MICPNCCGAGCRASGFGRFPQQEKMHAVYGNCAACSGAGVIDWDDLVEVYLSDWRSMRQRTEEEERAERVRWELEWRQQEEDRKRKRDEASKQWFEQHRELISKQQRINRERAEAEWRERWRLTFELYGIPKEKMDGLKFPPTNRQ